ncbi:hypothetical protein HA402_004492 [Bradysia odoriphaga]|nr:hypothetical protein HA402_004492 [Bradysia odoriphaga]
MLESNEHQQRALLPILSVSPINFHVYHRANVTNRINNVTVREDPTTTYQHFTYSGKYISRVERTSAIDIVENCTVPGITPPNAVMHVKCPYICGQKLPFENGHYPNFRISGGQQAALGSHPWLIVTAAHCLMKRNKQTVGQYDFMEILAGNLRQESFTQHEQTVRVSNVSPHNGYVHEMLHSDIALLELKESLRFNRWVQPICLPSPDRIISDSALNWKEEYEKMTCLAAGWGDFTFRGGLSPVDSAREVELRIVRSCDPENPGVFCAGYMEGGSDTCYGDSGGPFVCTSDKNGTNFFLAGIGSYGYNTKIAAKDIRCGEPNTFAAFTKMSLFNSQIDVMKMYAPNSPLWKKCPGRRCWSNKRCVAALNGIVECLDGEDEIYRMRERRND